MQTKRRKRSWMLVTALAVISLASLSASGENKPSQDKVAVINGSVITQGDLDAEMSRVERQLLSKGGSVNDSRLSQIKKEALENLIDGELLYQESQKKGIKVDETAVNEELTTLKKRFSSEAEFNSAVSQMHMSEAVLKSRIERWIAIQEFIDREFAQKVTVSDQETKAYYESHPDFFKQPEQVRATHILIKVGPQAGESQKAEAHKKLEKIQKKLQEGMDFSVLAKESSQCPSSVKDGDVGYFARGQMVKPFEDAAFALKPGQVSGIVETNFGYHLIKVMDRKPESMVAYGDIKERLEQYLKQDKVRKEVGLYVEKLKKQAKIERFLPEAP